MKASKEYLKALASRELQAVKKLSPKGFKPYFYALKAVGTLPLSLAIFLSLWEFFIRHHFKALHYLGLPLIAYVEALFLTFMLSLFFTEPTKTTKFGFFASIGGSLLAAALLSYFPEINSFFLLLQGAFLGNFLTTLLINKKDKYFRAQVKFLTSVTSKIMGRFKIKDLPKMILAKKKGRARNFTNEMLEFAMIIDNMSAFILGILIFLPALFLIIAMLLQGLSSLLVAIVGFILFVIVLTVPAFLLHHLLWEITFRLFLGIFRFFGGKK